MRGEEERICARRRGGGEEEKGPQGTKKRLRARRSAARNFCPTRGSSDYLVGQLRKDWRELPLWNYRSRIRSGDWTRFKLVP